MGGPDTTADNHRIGHFSYVLDDLVRKITTTRRLTRPIASTMFSPPIRAKYQQRRIERTAQKAWASVAAETFHERCHCRIGRQGQGDQQVSRCSLQGAGVLWPRARPAVEGRLG